MTYESTHPVDAPLIHIWLVRYQQHIVYDALVTMDMKIACQNQCNTFGSRCMALAPQLDRFRCCCRVLLEMILNGIASLSGNSRRRSREQRTWDVAVAAFRQFDWAFYWITVSSDFEITNLTSIIELQIGSEYWHHPWPVIGGHRMWTRKMIQYELSSEGAWYIE